MGHLRLQVLGGILSAIFEDAQTSLVDVMDLFPHWTSRDLGERRACLLELCFTAHLQ